MITRFAFALALFAAGPASALSCLAPTIAGTFQTVNDAEEWYVIALGSLKRAGENIPDGPDTGDMNNRVGYEFAAQFDGHFASAQGFVTERSMPVTVDVNCIAAWCGYDSVSPYGLYFLRVDDGERYVLQAGPCPWYFIDSPVEHQLLELIGLMP